MQGHYLIMPFQSLFFHSLYVYMILKMAIKKKLNPTSIQTNKLIAELLEKRENKSTG